MNKHIVKEILLSASILLFIFATHTYGCGKGPCWDWNNGCGGGFWGGPNTCNNPPYCDGTCPHYVPKGAPDEYCVGLFGSCTAKDVHCSRILKYKCFPGVFDPPHCLCAEWGVSGWSWRSDC